MPEYAPCPNCDCEDATRVGWTWWGGALGPALLTHVKCEECGTQYNGKTGKSNTTGIVIYTVAIIGVVIVLGAIFGGQ
ncbi:MAG: hypothetical protein KDA88_05580 [Planctomycetaceae bacterium]|nr:hypothetical protein [Planctomycetaceae bacterium]MCB9952899.1 hypothetical protein [Planctomycetaceae bacterium]